MISNNLTYLMGIEMNGEQLMRMTGLFKFLCFYLTHVAWELYIKIILNQKKS